MLKDILDTYSTRIGLEFDFTNIQEASEDFIDVTDPDLNFGEVREKILSNVVLRRKVVDQSVASIELFDQIWINGNKVNVKVLFEVAALGIGTRAKILVKTVDVNIDGNVKSFLSIEAYNNYVNSKVVGA